MKKIEIDKDLLKGISYSLKMAIFYAAKDGSDGLFHDTVNIYDKIVLLEASIAEE